MTNVLEAVGFKHRPAGWLRKIERPKTPRPSTVIGDQTIRQHYVVATIAPSDVLVVILSQPSTPALIDAAGEIAMVAELEGVTCAYHLRSIIL